jgi:hypothetical protein
VARAVAQHNNDNVFARAGAACNQTFACGVCVTGFHPVAVRDASEKFIRIFKLSSAAIGVPEDKLRKTNDGSNRLIGVGSAGYKREVARA